MYSTHFFCVVIFTMRPAVCLSLVDLGSRLYSMHHVVFPAYVVRRAGELDVSGLAMIAVVNVSGCRWRSSLGFQLSRKAAPSYSAVTYFARPYVSARVDLGPCSLPLPSMAFLSILRHP
jgi:hypothetical protein